MAIVIEWGPRLLFSALMFGVVRSIEAAVKLYIQRDADAEQVRPPPQPHQS